jgi:predicted AAA+ superfamily ATPase
MTGILMYIERDITDKLKQLASQFPVIYLTGPRQSGKSTLLKYVFPEYNYVSLEDKDIRQFAIDDPRGFLAVQGEYAIIDEAQRAPDLFSYIQTSVDEKEKAGIYLLSGSQNFLMMKSISQSLAGRVGILTLLPFSLTERGDDSVFPDANTWIYSGGYPKLSSGIAPEDYFPSYIKTYLERDIRNETGVKDLSRFRTFLRVCASRVGTTVNFTDIGKEIAADARTIQSWLSILEESYILFRLRPWHGNYGKRQTKTPKLYFWDTGLLCALLGIEDASELTGNSHRGYIFENAVIAEFAKKRYNIGKEPRIYFWRDSDDQEKEIDLVIDKAGAPDLIEIKSSQTANPKFTKNIRMFAVGTGLEGAGRYVVYDGPDGVILADTTFINWRNISCSTSIGS